MRRAISDRSFDVIAGGGGGFACVVLRQLVNEDPMLAPVIRGWKVVSWGSSSVRGSIRALLPGFMRADNPAVGFKLVVEAVLLTEMLNGLVPEFNQAAAILARSAWAMGVRQATVAPGSLKPRRGWLAMQGGWVGERDREGRGKDKKKEKRE
jgi:hypothetical protein